MHVNMAFLTADSNIADVQVAEKAVQRHVNDNTVSWLDHGTEHPHRIALSVHISSLQDCLSHLRQGFQQHAVQVSPYIGQCIMCHLLQHSLCG